MVLHAFEESMGIIIYLNFYIYVDGIWGIVAKTDQTKY